MQDVGFYGVETCRSQRHSVPCLGVVEQRNTGVLSLIDHTHSSATELSCDFVVGHGLADHV